MEKTHGDYVEDDYATAVQMCNFAL